MVITEEETGLLIKLSKELIGEGVGGQQIWSGARICWRRETKVCSDIRTYTVAHRQLKGVYHGIEQDGRVAVLTVRKL